MNASLPILATLPAGRPFQAVNIRTGFTIALSGILAAGRRGIFDFISPRGERTRAHAVCPYRRTMTTIERSLASIREDRRADYLWQTKSAADAVGCVPNKFGDWWFRNRAKLIALFASQPGETAAELAAICAEGAALMETRRQGDLGTRRPGEAIPLPPCHPVSRSCSRGKP
jgi:hypothetical protein